MEYQNIEIEAFNLDKRKDQNGEEIWSYEILLNSQHGEMHTDNAVEVNLNYTTLKQKIRQLNDRELAGQDLISFGKELANYLIPTAKPSVGESIRHRFLTNKKIEMTNDKSIRLRLKLPYEFSKIPWEFVYIDPPGGPGKRDGFLALNGRISIVRHEAFDSPIPTSAAPEGNIKLVAAFASPENSKKLDLKQERLNLEEAVSQIPEINSVIQSDANFKDLENALLAEGIDVFHFAGHGEIDEEMADAPGQFIKSGKLLFNDKAIKAEQLAINLRDTGVRLAMLNACNSDNRDEMNPWNGIATMLVKTGIPAVVANQFKIRDDTAIAFSQGFYKALVAGSTVERAVSAGRKAAYNADPGGRDWGIQVLYMRSERSQVLFKGTADESRKQMLAGEIDNLLLELPLDEVPERRRVPSNSQIPSVNINFIGRSKELKQLARMVNEGGTDTYTAIAAEFHGVGKSQLAIEFCHRYGHYFSGGVFWLNAKSKDSLQDDLLKSASKMNPNWGDLAPNIQLAKVKGPDGWQSNIPRLLIFDKLDDADLLNQERPSHGGCHILITTNRKIDWQLENLKVNQLDLGPFEERESVHFLTNLVGTDEKLTEADARVIADKLKHLPQILFIAGSYIRKYATGKEYLEQLAPQSPLQAIDKQASSLGQGELSYSNTINISYDHLRSSKGETSNRETEEINRISCRLLHMAALLEPNKTIPVTIFFKALSLSNEAGGAFQQSISMITELGLARKNSFGHAEQDGIQLQGFVSQFILAFGEKEEGDYDRLIRQIYTTVNKLNLFGYPR
ncbi:MAG: CHAT domain-containing protein, partial [Chloroflexota bacterium]